MTTPATQALTGTILTRTVCVNITGSLANLAMAGPQAALWKPVEGKQTQVFGMGANVDAAVATNQLRTALIHEVNLLEHRSTFPVPMGVDVNCVPKQVPSHPYTPPLGHLANTRYPRTPTRHPLVTWLTPGRRR